MRRQWRHIADQIRFKVPKLAAMMGEAETDAVGMFSNEAASTRLVGIEAISDFSGYIWTTVRD